MIVYHAPDRSDNVAGPREFAYLAEVDILGWKFRKMKSGALVIDTPRGTLEAAESSMLMWMTPEHQALLLALMALPTPEGDAQFPEHWENVGH